MEVTTEKTGLILAYMDYFKEMECQYPKAKFIFNTRNMQDWLESRSKHGGPGENNLLKRYMRLFGITREQVLNLWTSLTRAPLQCGHLFPGQTGQAFYIRIYTSLTRRALRKFSGITNA